MFGATSTWGQQGQQGQQAQSGFGQPASGFGAFGAQQQQQQPQQQPAANPMFGNINNNTSSGFGAFGGGATQNTGSSLFGAPKPAGFGGFGSTTGTAGTSTFGGGTGTSGFGQAQGSTSGGVFGQPAGGTTTNFGSTGAFGANKPAAFGSTPSQTGAFDNSAPVTTGTLNPPYSAFAEKETPTSTTQIQYQSISCMPAYRGTSFEELRMQDYTQGRKTANASNTFGHTNAFGGQQASTSTFGQPQQAQPSTSIFGGGNAAGTTGTTNTGFGAFSQPQQPAAAPAFGSFGQTQQAAQTQNSGFGAFGQPQQAQPQSASTGVFGSFGANKPAQSPFGAPTTTNTFGSTPSAFGQNTQQQQQQSNAFGQPAQTTSTFGSFGQPAKPATTFGAPATQPQTGAFGSFGQTQAQPAQPAQQTGLFGGGAFGQQNQQANQQQPAQQSLFGAPATQPAATGAFGSNLFGANAQQPQQNAQAQAPAQTSGFGSLFNKPATPTQTGTNMFGSFGQTANTGTAAPQTNLFGQSTAAQPTSAPSFGLFGAPKPAAPAMGATPSTAGTAPLFGNANGQATNMFQSSTTSGPAPGTLTASIAQPIGSNLPIFSLLPPGPRAISLEQSTTKKKPGFFVDIPTRSPVPRVQLGYSPANSKLRGFASSTNMGSSTSNPFSSSFNFTAPKQAAGLSINRAGSTPLLGGLPGRAGSPSLGSGGRQSVKKLILDKRVEPSDLFNRSARSASPAPSRPGITFSPALGVAAREKEAAAAAVPAIEPASSRSNNNHRASNRFTAAEGDNADMKEGDYWSKPDLQTLISMSHADLRSCKNLVIGRVGYGEIHFLEPVDLTGLTRIRQLYGDVVKLGDKECSVYPEIDESEKPAPGTHLNVRAKIVLYKCWPHDKATREPIKEESHPLMVRHMKKLKGMRDTHFEGYECAEGKWTFTVEHF